MRTWYILQVITVIFLTSVWTLSKSAFVYKSMLYSLQTYDQIECD